MQNSGNRPQRLKPEELDSAVDEALERVEEGGNLPQEELDKINGGVISLPHDPIMGAMVSQ